MDTRVRILLASAVPGVVSGNLGEVRRVIVAEVASGRIVGWERHLVQWRALRGRARDNYLSAIIQFLHAHDVHAAVAGEIDPVVRDGLHQRGVLAFEQAGAPLTVAAVTAAQLLNVPVVEQEPGLPVGRSEWWRASWP